MFSQVNKWIETLNLSDQQKIDMKDLVNDLKELYNMNTDAAAKRVFATKTKETLATWGYKDEVQLTNIPTALRVLAALNVSQ